VLVLEIAAVAPHYPQWPGSEESVRYSGRPRTTDAKGLRTHRGSYETARCKYLGYRDPG